MLVVLYSALDCSAHLFLVRLVPQQSLDHVTDFAECWTFCGLQVPTHLHYHVPENINEIGFI